MSTVDDLLAAKDLILDGWCQNAYARTKDGVSVQAHSSFAVQWCSAGASLRVAGNDWLVNNNYNQMANFLIQALQDTHNLFQIESFNDSPTTTKQDVLDVYDAAIALAKESENAGGFKELT